jgi:hypothetical protein
MHQKTYIQNETDDFIEIHRQEFDYENLIATMAVTIFRQRRRLWERIDETHQERGYPVADVEFLLNETGLEIVDRFGSIRKRTELQSTSPRVWFVAQKPPSIHP